MLHKMKTTSSSAIKRSKTIGDSIKNHVFRKAMTSKLTSNNPTVSVSVPSKEEVHVSCSNNINEHDRSLLDSPKRKCSVKYNRL